MKAIMVMYDSLCRRFLSAYGCCDVQTPNFDRLAKKTVAFDNCYIGSMPCMPARRELHTGRYNFMHRSWGPIEPFDDSMPSMLDKAGIHTHLISDHKHYWEDGGATYHSRYSTWEITRGQEGDHWKGYEELPEDPNRVPHVNPARRAAMKQIGLRPADDWDVINRRLFANEEDMPQAVTFKNGLEFIDRNHDKDNWFLHIETFDPHEPFFVSERFKKMYQDPDYCGREYDWPGYHEIEETEEEQKRCINNYKALVSMCDYYLGKVLDAMDQYDLWKDTMLIVNTDHGFILTEHGWWGKNIMPQYNEIAHLPLFIWDPRSGKKGERRKSLVQMIDMAPTLLRFFGLEPTKDMLGHDLARTIDHDEKIREFAFFGLHGRHFNVTDGHYVYMRCSDSETPLYEYTLMPTHMNQFFSAQELGTVELAQPFSFTKGLKTMKIRTGFNSYLKPDRFGELLFDLDSDPGELHPIIDESIKTRMTNAIRKCMLDNDAPRELYTRFSINGKEAE